MKVDLAAPVPEDPERALDQAIAVIDEIARGASRANFGLGSHARVRLKDAGTHLMIVAGGLEPLVERLRALGTKLEAAEDDG